jgi:hypothetical protein
MDAAYLVELRMLMRRDHPSGRVLTLPQLFVVGRLIDVEEVTSTTATCGFARTTWPWTEPSTPPSSVLSNLKHFTLIHYSSPRIICPSDKHSGKPHKCGVSCGKHS